jgi:lipoprotein-anchoring transpeptidase ErfK/SrfK
MRPSSRRRLLTALLCALTLAGTVPGASGPVIEFKLPPPPPRPAPAPEPEPAAEEPAPTPSGELQARSPEVRPDSPAPAFPPVPVKNWLEAQVALAREGYSCGPIDGVGGAQTAAALRAYQEQHDIPATGALDPATRAQLQLTAPLLTTTVVTAADLARLQPLSPTWLGKSQQTALAYETALELVAERFHASHNLLRQLNPDVDWNAVATDTPLAVPGVGKLPKKPRAARVVIQLAAHTLEVFDADGALLVHFPVSIASRVEKRPVGELHVAVVAPNPDYTFNPDVFPESEEARSLGRKLMLPPGPNNPVGLAWIGLDLSGYGIHGTPKPEQVGRTESHGCFRLANWDALTLLDLTWVGLPVVVLP